MTDLPIACSLNPEALKARRAGLLSALVERAYERHELSDGLQLRFSAESAILGEITRVVDAERLCCRFLRFTIAVQPDEGPITLELTGPTGTAEFIGALLDRP